MFCTEMGRYHVRSSFPWNDQLEKAVKDAKRAPVKATEALWDVAQAFENYQVIARLWEGWLMRKCSRTCEGGSLCLPVSKTPPNTLAKVPDCRVARSCDPLGWRRDPLFFWVGQEGAPGGSIEIWCWVPMKTGYINFSGKSRGTHVPTLWRQGFSTALRAGVVVSCRRTHCLLGRRVCWVLLHP